MPEVVEAEAMAIRNLDDLLGCGPEMVFDQHVRHARCFAVEPGGGKDEISSPAYAVVSRQFFSKPMTSGFRTTGFFEAADFGSPNLPRTKLETTRMRNFPQSWMSKVNAPTTNKPRDSAAPQVVKNHHLTQNPRFAAQSVQSPVFDTCPSRAQP
jgi:hypothetical protein